MMNYILFSYIELTLITSVFHASRAAHRTAFYLAVLVKGVRRSLKTSLSSLSLCLLEVERWEPCRFGIDTQ